MDCSLPGSSVHGICQARVLEWVAIAFSHLKWQTSVIARLQLRLNGGPVLQLIYNSVLFGKQRKIHPRDVRASQPKRKEGLNFASSFDMLCLLTLSLPYVIWASQGLFLLPEVLTLVLGLSFVLFLQASPFFFF